MPKPEFSVILNSYNPTEVHLHMTMACIAAITKFTDMPYELIVIDNRPNGFEDVLKIRDDYHVLVPYKYIVNQTNQNVYRCYNQGAELAASDNLVFIQSDVYCHERTINKLVRYLGEYNMAFPQQIPVSRADVRQISNVEDGGITHVGQRDAGMIAITREAFDKSGGWDDRFRNLLGEAAFFARCDNAGVTWTDRTNAFVTHIMAGNNLSKTDSLYNEEMAHDAVLLKEYR